VNASQPAHRIPELDGARALAILLVIGCHYSGFSAQLGGLPSLGWIGVEIFFVLSGFLITSILIELRGTESAIKVFYVRRILRIFPVYCLTVLLIAAITLAHREHIHYFKWMYQHLLFLQSFNESRNILGRVHRVLSGVFPWPPLFQRSTLPIADQGFRLCPWADSLSVVWSLSIEEYFYVFWAPIVLFVKSYRAVVFAALLVFLSSAAVQYLGSTEWFDYFNFFCRIGSIMAGALLALFLSWRSRSASAIHLRTNVVLKVAAVLATVVLVLILVWNIPFLGRELRDSLAFTALGLPALSILFAASLGLIVRSTGGSFFVLRILRLKPVRYLGTISYALYLFHIPVYLGFLRLQLILGISGPAASVIFSVASFVVAVAVSSLSWKYFERPIMNLKDRWAPTRAAVRVFSVT
jgi:peptidoglycan/LPS O-acetylase OafA/YrhL